MLEKLENSSFTLKGFFTYIYIFAITIQWTMVNLSEPIPNQKYFLRNVVRDYTRTLEL